MNAIAKLRLAEYRCCGCGHEFQAFPGPVAQRRISSDAPWAYVHWTEGKQVADDGCPACGHVYLKWLNYERDFARR
jgi:hypothetical protein